MQKQTAWATGFLTQLILTHLHRHHPSIMQKLDPRTFFSGMEGYESLQDPQALLMDGHAWLPEEVLREILVTAERISGRKEIAHQAAMEFFVRSAEAGDQRVPSIFEIMARSFDDVRTVALCSGLWAGVYTTFLRLQAIPKESADTEMIVLSQSIPGFRPLLSSHFMLMGNYEGFVRLYDHVKEARFEEEFLQYRVQDIVNEFEGYAVRKEADGLSVVEIRTGRRVAAFETVVLDREEISDLTPALPALLGGGHPSAAGKEESGPEGMIVRPQIHPNGSARFRILSGRPVAAPEGSDPAATALRVRQSGVLRMGSLEYAFKEGALFEAPYSRYRFQWREDPRGVVPAAGIEARMQKITYLLFAYLQELKATQQRLLAYAVENKALHAENVYLRREVQEVNEDWISRKPMGNSPAMRAVIELVDRVAPTDSTVLITGETGTGKELIARRIHQIGNRSRQRFVAINCGAVPEGLLESELFGHERGAFTGALNRKIGKFEWANGGTLFLDEIGEMPPAIQVKLLRVLQEREIVRVGGNDPIELNVRIVAATNQDLGTLVEKGMFRKDLFYRLNVIPIRLPALRERKEDIPILTEYLLAKLRRRLRKDVLGISPVVLDRMKSYGWPGNIRELENVMERALTLIPPSQTTLAPELFPPEITYGTPPSAAVSLADALDGKTDIPSVGAMIDRMEWQALMDAMKNEGSMDSFLRKIEWAMARRAILEYGSKTEAARVLNRTYRWIRKLEKEMEERPSA
jgi:transcriptional regulator with GAF, ATPase, and Fis domain